MALSALFVLIGCEAAPSNDSTSKPPTTEQPTQTEQIIESDEPITKGEQPSGENLETPDEEVSDDDITLYEGATQLGDTSYCEKIKNSNLREECSESILVQDTVAEAIEMEDIKLCDKLNETKAEVCKVQVEILKKNAENFRDSTPAELDIMKAAVEAGDIEVCNQLQSERKKENCQTNVEAMAEYSQYYDLPAQ